MHVRVSSTLFTQCQLGALQLPSGQAGEGSMEESVDSYEPTWRAHIP